MVESPLGEGGEVDVNHTPTVYKSGLLLWRVC